MTNPDGALLAAVVEAAPTPLWVIGETGRVQLVNQAAIAVLGYAEVDDLIGRPSHCTLHGRHPDGSEYPQDACPIVGRQERKDSRPRGGAEWFTMKSGRSLPVVWSARKLRHSGATLLSFEDASDQMAAETQRTRWNDRLVGGAAEAFGGRTRSASRDHLMRQVHEHFRDPAFTVAVLARKNHMSIRSVQTLFAEVGRAPGDEIRRARLEFARRLLERGAAVQTACHECGFNDPGTFTRAFRRHFGYSPSGYLRELTG